MIQTKRITELSRLRDQAISAPPRLVDAVEEKDGRGETWWVLLAFNETRAKVGWLLCFPDSKEAALHLEDGAMNGRWDSEHEIFFPEDGPSVNILGDPTSLANLEEEAEDEETWRDP